MKYVLITGLFLLGSAATLNIRSETNVPVDQPVQQPVANANSNQPNRWRVLVANDDGIDSPGLRELVSQLSKVADVVVCAPDSNRSGAGQSVPSLNRPMQVKDAKVDGAIQAVAISGSPADAVSYGLIELGKNKKFDLVVSGINSSANVGGQVHSSGTIGAAMEGVYRGVPSIAISQKGHRRDYELAAKFAVEFIGRLKTSGAEKGIVYSINIPSPKLDEIKGVKVRPMGGTQISILGYRTLSEKDGVKTVRTNLRFEKEGPVGSDCEALFDGYITISPFRFDWTDSESIEKLKTWNLKIPSDKKTAGIKK